MLYTHSYLIGGLFIGVGNALFFRLHHNKSIERGSLTKEKANKYFAIFSLSILIPSICLWVLQLSSGENATLAIETWGTTQQIIGWFIQITSFSIFFIWVWFFNGNESISEYYRLARIHPTYTGKATGMKFFSLFILISLIIKLIKLV